MKNDEPSNLEIFCGIASLAILLVSLMVISA